jgi:hypothetical protein
MTAQIRTWLGGLFVTGLLAAGASAQAPGPWADSFDTYAAGSVINGQGGWDQWALAVNTTSVVSNARRRSPANCVEVSQTSDLVHQYTGYTSGHYIYKGYLFIQGPGSPNPLVDKTYFIMLNRYAPPFGGADINWSVQVTFDGTAGTWSIDAGTFATAVGAIIVDQWVEMKADIDLASDSVSVYYGGALMAPAYTWTKGVFGTDTNGALAIAAVDLYSPTTSALQTGSWDDITLASAAFPEPSSYCTAKVNSLGCTPFIASSGVASASNATFFKVRGENVRNQKSGLLFYGVSGAAGTPFQGGTLCVKSQIKRTPGVVSGGTPSPANDCSGIYSIDMNAFAAGLLGGSPLPALSVAGTPVNCQWWGRDPGFPAPNNTTLTNGLAYTVGI